MPSVKDLAKARVIVVGDAMIDRWVWGHYSKIGPEGVPVFLQHDVEDRPGGAANVLANLEALGCWAHLLAKPFEKRPVKTRYAATGAVFRSDREDCSPLSESLERAFMDFLERIELPHVLVISDYAKGVCTPSLCRQLIGWAKAKGVKVVVDPKGDDWAKYAGADVITPNEHEVIAYEGSRSLADAVLVTAGPKGMWLWQRGKPRVDIPATAREVYDVTGAGDSVVAVLAAALAVGFDLETAARLSNAAAGVVVGKRATATCSLAELEAAYIDVRNVQKKPIVGFTNGCFDLFHAGHKHFLKECQKWCDQLVVMVNTDDSVRQLKGPGRPVQQAKFRLFNVRTELRPSDSTWLFETTEGLIQSIAAHKPDVIFKGMEYETKDVVGADLARVILVPMLPGYSTTSEIAKRA